MDAFDEEDKLFTLTYRDLITHPRITHVMGFSSTHELKSKVLHFYVKDM